VSVVNRQATFLNVSLTASDITTSFAIKRTNARIAGVNGSNGNLALNGISQALTFENGLRIRKISGDGVKVDKSGNMACAGILENQNTFLNTPAFLIGGLVVKNSAGSAVAYISPECGVRIRGNLMQGFLAQ
jgi:hypothetical protein